jgi:hypothetical protein
MISQTKDIPILGTLTQLGVGLMDQQSQLSTGALKGAGAMVGGIAQMITNPVDTAKGLYTMVEHIPTFGGIPGSVNPLKMLSATGDVLFNGADPKQRFASVLDIRQSAQQDARFWQGGLGSILQPMQESWNAGRPAEAIGRGAFEVVSMPEVFIFRQHSPRTPSHHQIKYRIDHCSEGSTSRTTTWLSARQQWAN